MATMNNDQHELKVTGIVERWRPREERGRYMGGSGVSEQWHASDILCPEELQDILLVVSDGSENDLGCTYELVAYLNGHTLNRSAVVSSHYDEAHSHSAETRGFLGTLQVAVTLHDRGMMFTEVYLVADNETTINTAQKGRVTIGASEYDFLHNRFVSKKD